MPRRSIQIITAAAMAAIAGHAIGQQQQQITPSEGRHIGQKLEQSDQSLVDAIQLAERETGGKALAASIMTSSDVQRIYQRQGGDQAEQQRDRLRQQQDNQQRDMERQRQNQQGRQQGQQGQQDQQAGQQRGLHASVTCLVNDSQLRKVVINLEESRVVEARSLGAGDSQRGDLSAGDGQQMRLASNIINANAVTAQGDDIGDIDDLALDVTSGKVRYGVLRAGGFLGMGGDRHAVPLSALTFMGDDEVRINVTEQQLEQREGFDTDRWPQQPSPAWGGQQPDQQQDQQPGEQRPGERQPEVQRPGQTGQQQMSATVEKASDVIGATLHGAGEASVGDIDDIVVKPSDSSIAHYVVATDDGKVAVPASEIRMTDRRLTLDMEQTEFDQLPRFRDNENPDWTNPQWLEDNEDRNPLPGERNPGRRGGG